jgi:hypothetical protein
MSKLSFLNSEIFSCQSELKILRSSAYIVGQSKKLIISTGDISDVDGFYALAEYAASGSDVLFIMNFPAYLSYEGEYVECAAGLGYKYGLEFYLKESKKKIQEYIDTIKLSGARNLAKQFEAYNTFMDGDMIKTSVDIKHTIKQIIAWIGFFLAQNTWDSVGFAGKGTLHFCIGGVNDVNPFHFSTLKNEIFVYANVVPLNSFSPDYCVDEGLIVGLDGFKSGIGLLSLLKSYSDIFIDFNGSMAFYDRIWEGLIETISGRIRGVFVMGGVYSYFAPTTMPSLPKNLNRLSCATMNQLYHPSNTSSFFNQMNRLSIEIIVVTNNEVHDLKLLAMGWEQFIFANGVHSIFVKTIATAYYSSPYNPPQKAFDLYVAKVLVKKMKGLAVKTYDRSLHFDQRYGVNVISKRGKSWSEARDQLVSNIEVVIRKDKYMIEYKLSVGDARTFTSNKKDAFELECKRLDLISSRSVPVKTIKSALDEVNVIYFSDGIETAPMVSDRRASEILKSGVSREYFDDFKYIWSVCRLYDLMSAIDSSTNIRLKTSKIVEDSPYAPVQDVQIWFGDTLSEIEQRSSGLDVSWQSSHNIEFILSDGSPIDKNIKIRDRSGEFDFKTWTEVMDKMFGIKI